ncbi:MAG: rane protein [Chitinophagaceae bacterium]|nr:rane protein [Chitinophagaceae bacterium]
MAAAEPNIRVLIIDDDEDDYFIISDYLLNRADHLYTVTWCPDFEKAIVYLASRAYDVFFVDYNLGINTGLEFLQAAAKSEIQEPIIFLTGMKNRDVDMQAMKYGAADYLVKSELTTDKLERTIRYSLERSRSLKALKESEKKYRTIFERSKDAVFIADENLVFLDLNNSALSLFNGTREQMLGKSLYDFITEESQKEFLSEQFKSGNLNENELTIQNIDGEVKVCILSAEAEQKEINKGQIQAILHDITELKKAEKAKLQAEKLAASARLIKTLAHEVRNPLNNINLSAEQLIADIKDPSDKPLLDIIVRNNLRISRMIDDLLASARPSDLDFEDADLHDIVREGLLVSEDRIALQHIQLKLNLSHQPLIVKADPAKLKIAISNLIINAVEAIDGRSQQGCIQIETVANASGPVLKISDNGCGIPKEHLSKLFAPYFTSKKNGMGLGLASTLNILQAHQAFIDVESITDEGTTFSILFKNAGNIKKEAVE